MTVLATPAPAASTPATPTTPPAAPVAAVPTPPAVPPAPAAPPAAPPAVPPAAPIVAGQPPAPAVPVVYALKVPEGADALFDAADLTQFESVAKTEGWTPDEAQERVNDHAAALTAQRTAFLAETTADPTYGGEKLADTQRLGNLALDKIRPVGSPRGDSFRRFIAKTGHANNIEVVSLLADFGKLFAEDRPGGSAPSAGGAREYNLAVDLYKNTTP